MGKDKKFRLGHESEVAKVNKSPFLDVYTGEEIGDVFPHKEDLKENPFMKIEAYNNTEVCEVPI
jgi:hypothetical protein